MTTDQVPGVDDLRAAPPVPCPCGHGDNGAETDRERPLIARAAGGDARAFAELYDHHVDDVYRYLLAWTGEQAPARELTEQVFRGALTWLSVIARGEGDLGAWLLTVARDAVAQHRGAGWVIGPAQVADQPQDVFAAVERLDDPHREVAVLRLLLGHSVAHTARLTGYTDRVVEELQLAACSSIWYLLSGAPAQPPPPGGEEGRLRWFEHCLEGATLDPAGDPGLSELLAVADALRQGAAAQVPLPDDAFIGRLRQELLQALRDDGADHRSQSPGRIGRAFGLVRFHVLRHPWVATTIAASAIGVVFGLQMGASSPVRSACGAGACLVTTTEAGAGGSTGAALLPGASGPDQTATSATLAGTTSPGPVPGGVPTTTRAARTTVPPTTAAPTTTTRPSSTRTTHPKTTKTTAPTTTTAPPPAPTTTVAPQST